ncbi:sugar phosphate nucleotidyltransferase [Lyngbya sp. PCC 8106]|uniref:sugar phosphate nucleotidyltransferase n=1 Tax=Lyngbya sp. (strain PCC 8106) TaxID=313612 RepID=UPI0000EAD17E|nr:sugar phosphate nucleotidyltransferase [Lyngbya sp. PCC 8106]EAW38294.1 UTP-glucose-1-phosphate uridylyltransferase [Lyngbya sp. PCC 8106]
MFNLESNNKQVKKAVIPAAGFGTRMFPATKGLKKEFFPIIDRDGRAKPIILVIVEEAIQAGIEEVGIIVQPTDREIFEAFFKHPPKPELWNKLSEERRDYSDYLQTIGERITILTQTQQEGYGHAVFCAAEWVNNQPFLLMLGDHVYRSDLEINCARQLLEIYKQVQQSVIGLRITPGEIIHHYGCVAGTFQDTEQILSLTQIYEKPSLDYASIHLRVEGLNENQFLSIFGLYVLEPQIFEILAAQIQANKREKGEFQLTSCLEILRQQQPITGYIIKGQCLDTGLPETYRQTMIEFGSRV